MRPYGDTPMHRMTIQLFAKAPVAGTVKTRLCPPFSPVEAAVFYTRLVEHAAVVVGMARDRLRSEGADVVAELWCAPDTAHPFLRDVAQRHGLQLRRQCNGDLGTKMRNALGSAMPGSALLLGSDVPALDANQLVASAHALMSDEVVIIPADDGGYALIGCRRQVPDCFGGIPWSTSSVMEETRKRLEASGARLTTLSPVWDVDTRADFDRLANDPRLSHLTGELKTIVVAEA